MPITLVPLDATATAIFSKDSFAKLFTAETTLVRHLHALHELWGKEQTALFDPLAVAACVDSAFFQGEDRRISVNAQGLTLAVDGPPNARVLTAWKSTTDAVEWFRQRIHRPVLAIAEFVRKDEKRGEARSLTVHVAGDDDIFMLGNRMTIADMRAHLKTITPEEIESVPFRMAAHQSLKVAHLMKAVRTLQDASARTFDFSVFRDRRGDTSSPVMDQRFPRRVHVVENFETDIERRWWLAGKLETDNIPMAGGRACRAVLTNDFDDLKGDKYAVYKAVIFNPVPGPPMGTQTRLRFRYHLTGSQELRVQIYSLSNGYHRQLFVKDLTRGQWAEASVDLTKARRPDDTGGPLSEDERIDDIQFYTDPSAELIIDDIVLYDAAEDDAETNPQPDVAPQTPAKEPFPKQVLFTGWFDTGKQGAEWPGDFEIVPHVKPLTWKAAKAVATPDGKSRWIRVDLRGERPVPETTRLRFRYLVRGAKKLDVELGLAGTDRRASAPLTAVTDGAWTEATVDFTRALRDTSLRDAVKGKRLAKEIVFQVPSGAELLVDDVLLYEPGK